MIHSTFHSNDLHFRAVWAEVHDQKRHKLWNSSSITVNGVEAYPAVSGYHDRKGHRLSTVSIKFPCNGTRGLPAGTRPKDFVRYSDIRMYKHFRRPCWVTQFRVSSLHGKVERHLRLPTRERCRASFPQRSMTSLPRCNSQSSQQQEPYESQSASYSRDRLRFATCCWIGSVTGDKIVFAYHRAGISRGTTLKYNWRSFNEQAVCVVLSETK